MHDKEFESTVRQYYQSIYNYCLSKLEDVYSAQDCTQETFLVLYRKTGKIEIDNIRAWLYRTADNIIKNYRKVSAKKKETSIDEADNMTYSDCYNDGTPFNELLDSQELQMLSEHYIDGYDISYIAAKNGKSTAAVYKMFQRLKEKLKKHVWGEQK